MSAGAAPLAAASAAGQGHHGRARHCGGSHVAVATDDCAEAEEATDSTPVTVSATEVLQPIDGNTGEQKRLTPFRISHQQSEEPVPCMTSSRDSLRLGRAVSSGGEQLEDHEEDSEQPPAAVPKDVLQNRANIMFSGATGAVVSSGEGEATSAPSLQLISDLITVVDASGCHFTSTGLDCGIRLHAINQPYGARPLGSCVRP